MLPSKPYKPPSAAIPTPSSSDRLRSHSSTTEPGSGGGAAVGRNIPSGGTPDLRTYQGYSPPDNFHNPHLVAGTEYQWNSIRGFLGSRGKSWRRGGRSPATGQEATPNPLQSLPSKLSTEGEASAGQLRGSPPSSSNTRFNFSSLSQNLHIEPEKSSIADDTLRALKRETSDT